jgi:hypothetical protein
MGIGRPRQARRRAGDLLPPQRWFALFALTAFAKNERVDLSQQDRNDFRQLTTLLVEAFKWRKP